MASVDWSARPDQIENLALREVGVCAFTTGLFNDIDCISEICSHSRAVLQRPQDRSRSHQCRPSLLLRRYTYHQSFPSDSQSIFACHNSCHFGIAHICTNRSCITRIVFLTRPSFTGIRRDQSRRADSISSKAQRALSRLGLPARVARAGFCLPEL
jgi:hypothetical protein